MKIFLRLFLATMFVVQAHSALGAESVPLVQPSLWHRIASYFTRKYEPLGADKLNWPNVVAVCQKINPALTLSAIEGVFQEHNLNGRLIGRLLMHKSQHGGLALFADLLASPGASSEELARELVHNFHAVEPGKCYRSAQLSVADLLAYVKKYNIKTVLCLREECAEEKKALEAAGIAFMHVPISPTTPPTRAQIYSILHVFDKCQTPLLMHCQYGQDRTGMVAALWVLDHMKGTKDQAQTQLAPWYGHHRQGPCKSMGDFIELWQSREWFDHCYQA